MIVMAAEICGFQRNEAVTVFVFNGQELEPSEKAIDSVVIVDKP
jgi:hypothetical protein